MHVTGTTARWAAVTLSAATAVVLVLNGGFVGGFAVSALLFRRAADGGLTG